MGRVRVDVMSHRRGRILFGSVLTAALLTTHVTAQPSAAPSVGEGLYLSKCSYCHGKDGEGGRGATLARPTLRHAADQAALRAVIGRGIAGTDMPGTSLSEAELEQVAAHVRRLGRRTLPPQPGNPKRGEQAYQTKGTCARCHTIDGRGGSFGPDLTEIGAARSPAYLRAAVVDPGVDVPRGFVQVLAVTKKGERITGGRVNEDTFSVQVRDAGGVVHSFWKAELTEMRVELGTSPMPSYRSAFSETELDDLVAYLSSLRGTP
jgi:putative heme-binding domain-containing protein